MSEQATKAQSEQGAARQDWTAQLRSGQTLSLRRQLLLVVRLSVPAVLAEISSIAMQYIDTAMVGSLGAAASASIGLVSSTTWLLGGLCISLATGFSVQVAHLVGAGRDEDARGVVRQALLVSLLFGMLVSAAAFAISGPLPVWLGGAADVCASAGGYFAVYAVSLVAIQLRQTAGSLLQCSGDMRTPSVVNVLLCALDVVFNAVFIFPTQEITVAGHAVTVYGAGLGVTGAALGSALSEVLCALLMLWVVCFRSRHLRLHRGGSWKPDAACLRTAARYGLPMALEHSILCGAQIASTRIVAPLGTVSVAANSLAVTAEGFCYMPGYGIASAATTLVGQSIGANRRDVARRMANLAVGMGVTIMACTGALMYFTAPAIFAMLTPDLAIRVLGVRVLRIEAFAEPLFAVSIVAAGALRGAGDTLVPSVLNLVSMWGVRITTATILAPRMGLAGVWVAMCGELCVRGLLFLARLVRGRWLEGRSPVTE